MTNTRQINDILRIVKQLIVMFRNTSQTIGIKDECSSQMSNSKNIFLTFFMQMVSKQSKRIQEKEIKAMTKLQKTTVFSEGIFNMIKMEQNRICLVMGYYSQKRESKCTFLCSIVNPQIITVSTFMKNDPSYQPSNFPSLMKKRTIMIILFRTKIILNFVMMNRIHIIREIINYLSSNSGTLTCILVLLSEIMITKNMIMQSKAQNNPIVNSMNLFLCEGQIGIKRIIFFFISSDKLIGFLSNSIEAIFIIYHKIHTISNVDNQFISYKVITMRLYNLTLQASTAIIAAVCGSFSSPKTQEVLIAKSKSLQLYTISEKGKMELITVEQLFCVVRTLVSFRIHGTNKDSVIVGSDSGKIIILQFKESQKRFTKTHQETFGKSGCRRIVPGQFIAADPRGQAIMIAALEKQKFVYALKRQNQKIIINSPRQAHKSHTLCCALVALDVGNQNSIFVALEIDYGEVEDKESLINEGGVRKSLVYYEMDFGMNNVIRKKDIAVDQTAHMLIPVPGAPDGPGGVLVVLEDFLFYKGNKEDKMVQFPLRLGRPDRKTQFTSYTTFHQKQTFFFLIGSELGDLFKVQFILKDGGKDVSSIKIEYFNTISCLTDMCLTKNGFLFCASEKQDHHLFLVGNSEEEVPYTHSQSNSLVEFKPKQLTNLSKSDTIEQFGPATDLKVADLKDDGSPQIYLLNASGSGKSFLRIIKQGLKVKQLSSVKYQKGQNLWSLKASPTDKFDNIIVISFSTKTFVLKLTENGYSQTSDTGIDNDTKTLHVGRLKDNSLVQIVPNGFRHISKGQAKVMKLKGTILKGITRDSQMAIGLAGGDIIYYELNNVNQLAQVEQTTLDDEVVSMDLAPIEKNRLRSQFLAVALRDTTVRIFQLSPQSCLKLLSTQNMKSQIESVVVEQMQFSNQEDVQRYGSQLYLYTGLTNGMLIRTSIDTLTGKLTDSRSKYLGTKPVKCIKMKILDKPAILALSSRPWLIYSYNNKSMSTLISYPYLDCAVSACIPHSPHAIIGFSDAMMKLISLQSFGQLFHSEKVQLDYSGKKLLIFNNMLGIVESERAPCISEKQAVWKSQITLYDPKEKQQKKIQKIPLKEDETCTAFCFCEIQEQKNIQKYLVVACAQGLQYRPKTMAQKTNVKVYIEHNNRFQFRHETQIEDLALVLHAWQGKILAGVGNCLRSYEIGKKKLLRKAEIKNLSSPVNTIKTSGKRIFVTEMSDSFHMYKYKAREQTFYDIADDVLPRYVTVSCLLDDHTILGADKFENVFVSRVPRNAEQDFQNNPNTYKFQWEHGYLNGAPFKMQQICSFYMGQIITSLEKTKLATSGTQILVYSTINGGIGALCPLQNREDVEFFTHLELYLRNMSQNISGRDHLNYRSYYSPCKGIIDGDLCEVFLKLMFKNQNQIAKCLDLTPQQIHKRLQQTRNKLI